MPLFFMDVCDLLSTLEELVICDPPNLPATRYQRQKDAMSQWFSLHNITIQEPSKLIVALLSAFLPAKRVDRVYSFQRPRLASLLKRCLSLGTERQKMLEQWKIPGRGDLGECVERVMRQTDDHLTLAECKVKLEQVDEVLANLASKSRFSGPKVKVRENEGEIQASLETIYRRLSSSEGKWLTRMILKDFSHLDIEANLLYSTLDVRLPDVMKMYDELDSAVTALKNLSSMHMSDGRHQRWTQHRASHGCFLAPQIGVKVGSPKWVKAKGGVKHATTIAGGRKMSVERKHDGEYCQIHIDLSKGTDCVQIFSKSGRDSTLDRIGVHDAIKEGLRIGKIDCNFAKNCIVEGELLVWCDKTAAVLDFHKIRKHVSRFGSFLGTENDSQPHHREHLMIVFFDLLLVDDHPVIHQIYKQRRQRLRTLVKRITGKADVVWRKVVDFSKAGGPRALKICLANAFVQRWEGLVMKPVNEPYFNSASRRKGRYSAQWIKLKKDCITGLGDTADLAVVGAGYDAKVAAKIRVPFLSWTHFFFACLTSKQDMVKENQTPSFFVLGCVQDSIKVEDLKTLNQHGCFMEMKPNSDEAMRAFDFSFARMDPAQPKMSAVFRYPFVCEIAGSGFDKPNNYEIFTLRFPRILKIHRDRDWRHSVCLDELQKMATIARTVPVRQTLEQELIEWVGKLDQLDRGINGKMASWDYTDDDEELHGAMEDAIPALEVNKHGDTCLVGRFQGSARTGSSETAPSERHCNEAGITWSPALTDSTIRAVSESNLPSFSIVSLSTNETKRMIRDFEITGHERGPKKARLSCLANLESEIMWPLDKTTAKRRTPLQELSSSTQPTIRQGMKNDVESRQASKGSFDPMSKRSASADQLVCKRYSGIMKKPTDSSSPAGDIFLSARPLKTSKRTGIQGVPLSPSTPSSEAYSQLPNPPCTNEASIPDLEDCSIVLDPRLFSKMPEILSRHLEEHQPPIISLPPNETSEQIRRLETWDANGSHILFLVGAGDTAETTASSLHKLAPCLRTWHPLAVHVWDWRVMLLKCKLSGRRARNRQDMADKLWIAKMSWVPPNPDGESSVLVQWADGETTIEPLDTFEKLTRSSTM